MQITQIQCFLLYDSVGTLICLLLLLSLILIYQDDKQHITTLICQFKTKEQKGKEELSPCLCHEGS